MTISMGGLGRRCSTGRSAKTYRHFHPLAALLAVLLLTLMGYSQAQASSALSYNPDGTVVGYNLPGIRAAGLPNFENPFRANWRANLKTKQGVTTGIAELKARMKDGDSFLFNLTESLSYTFEPHSGNYYMQAFFKYDGSEFTIDQQKNNYFEIKGKLDFDGTLLNGTLVTGTFDSWAYSADLIGFNTTIDIADSLICTVVSCTAGESAYLGDFLNGFTFDPFDDKATFEGLSVVTIPVPAALWLFGSGLLGLIGVARRKKQAA